MSEITSDAFERGKNSFQQTFTGGRPCAGDNQPKGTAVQKQQTESWKNPTAVSGVLQKQKHRERTFDVVESVPPGKSP